MSRTIQDILRNYNELDGSVGPTIAEIKLDIERALDNVDLTEEERAVIGALFLVEAPHTPMRKLNRHGGLSGRPKGTITQDYIAQLMEESNKSANALNISVTRTVQSACRKLADYLGADYQDDSRSTLSAPLLPPL